MTIAPPTTVSPGVSIRPEPGVDAVPSRPSDASLGRFESAMDAARNSAAARDAASGQAAALAAQERAYQVAQAGSGGVAAPVQASQTEALRALRALDINPAATPGQGPGQGADGLPPSTGDSILEGLKRIRGAFDAQAQSLAAISHSGPMNASTMLSLQVEVVKYGLLIDVTSKLTGKSTQAVDTLLKGQ